MMRDLNNDKNHQKLEIRYPPETQFTFALSKNNNHLALVSTNNMVTVYALDTKTKLFERNFKNDIGDDMQYAAEFVSFVECDILNDNSSVVVDIEGGGDNTNENMKLLICGGSYSGYVWMLVYDVFKNEIINRVPRLLPTW